MIGRLKRRAEFLQVAAANRKWVAPGLILQVRRQPEPQTAETEAAAAPAVAEVIRAEPIRVGFTASRKVGGAVERNRARRRLKAAAAQVLPVRAEPGHDYVLIARSETLTRPYALLLADLERALARLGSARQGGSRHGGARQGGPRKDGA